MKVGVIVPTYNECENIEPLVTEVLALGCVDYMIVVDDNSPDGTGAIADRLAGDDARVQVVHRPGKMGLGRAYVAGFHRGLELSCTAIFTMDADFSHQPRYIPAMIDLLKARDIVIGSRYVAGGGTRNWGVERQFLSAGANTFARMMLGLHAHDCTAGFRAYRSKVVESIPLDTIRSNGYSFLVEMLYQCQRRGYRVGEVPIVFEDRRMGQSKISKDEILRAMRTVLRLGVHRLRGRLAGSKGRGAAPAQRES